MSLPFTTEILDRALSAVSHRPSAVVCDIDGTISSIAPTPSSARLADGAREALIRLSELVDLVAVVTGRSAADAETMIDVPGALVVGNHGMEWILNGEHRIHPDVLPYEANLAEAMTELARLAASDERLKGAIVENKRLSGSVHYRLTPDSVIAKAILLEAAGALALKHNLRVTEGRMVVEVRPPVRINKGAALQRIAEDNALMGMVFFGDDVTDVDGFRVLQALRDARNFAGLSVAVADPEARPEVIAAADMAIDGVESCVRLLEQMAIELERSEG
jgi:trehalose 6-phosphate phosphatase